MNQHRNYHYYAGFWHKSCALTIDSCILATVNLAVTFILGFEPDGSPAFILYTLFNIVYFTAALTTMQSSPGGRLMGIVVRNVYGHDISFRQALIRSLLANLSMMFFGIGYLISAFSETKQTFHDRIAETYVKTEKMNANIKYFFYSFFLSVLSVFYFTFVAVVFLGIGSFQAILDVANQNAITLSQQYPFVSNNTTILKPKWINSAKRVKQKYLNIRQIVKQLKLNRPNKMASRLRRLQFTSKNPSFKRKRFKSIVPLKLRGVFASSDGRILEIGFLNNLFYQMLDFQIYDRNNKKLKAHLTKVYDNLILVSFWLPKRRSMRRYKLRVSFPKKYKMVYFYKNDALGSAYKLPTGTTVQLMKHFEFSIIGRDFKRLKFIPQNSVKRVVPINPRILRFKQKTTLKLSSPKYPITFVTMLYSEKMDYLEEGFRLR